MHHLHFLFFPEIIVDDLFHCRHGQGEMPGAGDLITLVRQTQRVTTVLHIAQYAIIVVTILPPLSR